MTGEEGQKLIIALGKASGRATRTLQLPALDDPPEEVQRMVAEARRVLGVAAGTPAADPAPAWGRAKAPTKGSSRASQAIRDWFYSRGSR